MSKNASSAPVNDRSSRTITSHFSSARSNSDAVIRCRKTATLLEIGEVAGAGFTFLIIVGIRCTSSSDTGAHSHHETSGPRLGALTFGSLSAGASGVSPGGRRLAHMQHRSSDRRRVVVGVSAAAYCSHRRFRRPSNPLPWCERAKQRVRLFHYFCVRSLLDILCALRPDDGGNDVGSQRKHLRDHRVSLSVPALDPKSVVLFDPESRLPHQKEQRFKTYVAA